MMSFIFVIECCRRMVAGNRPRPWRQCTTSWGHHLFCHTRSTHWTIYPSVIWSLVAVSVGTWLEPCQQPADRLFSEDVTRPRPVFRRGIRRRRPQIRRLLPIACHLTIGKPSTCKSLLGYARVFSHLVFVNAALLFCYLFRFAGEWNRWVLVGNFSIFYFGQWKRSKFGNRAGKTQCQFESVR